jgi:hypothetical protein
MRTQLTVLTALAALLLPFPLKAQITFERTYGGTDNDGAQAVVQTLDGGYYVVGYTYSTGSGGADVFVIATDQDGEELWTQDFGGAGDDDGYGVATFTDGGVLAAGRMDMGGQCDVALHSNMANGDQRWIRVYGGGQNDIAYSVARNSDGGFIVAGETYSFGAGTPNVYVLQIDSLGDTLWTRTYGGAGEDCAFSARQTADSGFIICGATYSYGAGQSDVYLIKTNAAGDTQWIRTYGGAQQEQGNSVLQTADSGYLICGTTYSFGAGDADVWLIRTDANGDTLWTRTFGGDTADLGLSVAQTADRGFILCGQTASFGAGNNDAWLIKTDSIGDTLWTRTFGGTSDDRGYSVQQTADEGYIIAGYTNSFGAGGGDFYLIKTNSLGNVAVEEPKTGPTRASGLSLSCEPNPFVGTTTVRLSPFALRHSPLTLRVYDAQGRRVRTFTVNREPCTVWDGKDDLGQPLSSGAYFIRCDITGEHATTRIVLQR